MAGGEKFVIYRDLAGGGYRWRLRSATGETIAASAAAHEEKRACEREVRAFGAGHPDAAVLDPTARGPGGAAPAVSRPPTRPSS